MSDFSTDSEMRSINLEAFKVSDFSFGYDIRDSILTFLMLAGR